MFNGPLVLGAPNVNDPLPEVMGEQIFEDRLASVRESDGTGSEK